MLPQKKFMLFGLKKMLKLHLIKTEINKRVASSNSKYTIFFITIISYQFQKISCFVFLLQICGILTIFDEMQYKMNLVKTSQQYFILRKNKSPKILLFVFLKCSFSLILKPCSIFSLKSLFLLSMIIH